VERAIIGLNKGEELPMSKEMRSAIHELAKSVEKNSPRIRRALAKKGKKPDPVLVFVGAQYFDCLNRLAKE
jgi:hypothetical protein